MDRSILMPLLDDASQGGPAGGAPTPAPTPAAAPAAPVASAPTTPSAAAQPAIPASTPAAATQQPPVEGWVPSYRIRETREAAIREQQETFRQQQEQLQAQIADYQAKLQRLVGVQQPDQNPEVDAVRQQFARLYPGLAQLEERAQELMGVVEKAGDLDYQTKHYWDSYGKQSMDRLFDHASKTMGSPLTEEGKRALHAAFTGFVQSSPEMANRYATDPGLVDEYWQAFSSSFLDPVRRSASVNVAGRAAASAVTPQDTPGGAPVVSQAPKLKDLDERANAAWAHYQQTARR